MVKIYLSSKFKLKFFFLLNRLEMFANKKNAAPIVTSSFTLAADKEKSLAGAQDAIPPPPDAFFFIAEQKLYIVGLHRVCAPSDWLAVSAQP